MFRTCLLTILFVCASLGSAIAAPVTHVAVRVSSLGEAIPPLVEKRISASIETIGNHVFLGADDGDVRSRHDEYTRMVYDIIDRVLIGYTVEHIELVPGPETTLAVQIRPWGDTIRRVHVRFDYGSLPALGQEMANTDLTGAASFIENLLTGLPVDALDWANGTVKSVMESELETELPEFYPHIVITPGADTTVEVYFLPKLPVVRNVNVRVDAENLPKVIFLSTRKHMEDRYAGLNGLPVAFVRRHQKDVERDLQQHLNEQWVIKKYKLRVLPSLSVAENMDINLKSETDFYDVRALAYIDVSRDGDAHHDKEDNTVLRAHVGRKIGKHHELYTDVEFMPASVDWNFIPGYGYQPRKGTWLGYDFESQDDSHHIWLRQQLGGRWSFRFDKDLTNHDEEAGLLYRLHEYVGLEYIISGHDTWLRVIGYL